MFLINVLRGMRMVMGCFKREPFGNAMLVLGFMLRTGGRWRRVLLPLPLQVNDTPCVMLLVKRSDISRGKIRSRLITLNTWRALVLLVSAQYVAHRGSAFRPTGM